MTALKSVYNKATKPVHIAPLVTLRILFGLVMFASILRFILKGWVYDLYVAPRYFFTYYGFDWIRPLGESAMYAVFTLLLLTALFIALGFFYKLSATLFFLSFTYVELIDKTNYLNHYYFISIVSLLLIFSPAHRYFSLDVLRKPSIKVTHIPLWIIGVFKIQMGMVYFFAGVAKLNYDWLFKAMPLKIWLPAKSYLPLIGPLFDKTWVAYLFSWTGAIYDLCIPFLLINRKFRLPAYGVLLIFHILTSILFNIGMFPYIMMGITLIFFPVAVHIKILDYLKKFLNVFKINLKTSEKVSRQISYNTNKVFFSFVVLHLIIQVLMPFRYLLYPGKLFWNEEGYRFSWRVMLMEKAGTTFFYVHDPDSGKKSEIRNELYLTPNQEKMMSTQPDMILQFAKIIEEEYRKQGIDDPKVTVDSYVTLNGSGSRRFINKDVDLTREEESFYHKSWVLPFNNEPAEIASK